MSHHCGTGSWAAPRSGEGARRPAVGSLRPCWAAPLGSADFCGAGHAAAAGGVSRTLAAYHLDRLAAAGLLAASYARPPGHAGPGAGRPAKHYERAPGELALTVPPRRYDLLARLLADALADGEPGAERAALTAAAEHEGRTAAHDGGDLLDTLTRRGYEPALTPAGDIDLRNCPFHRLAARHTQLVCGLNHTLLRAILASHGDNPDQAELAPRTDHCCITIHPDQSPNGPRRSR